MKMKYKLKYESIRFENNWKNLRIFKLVDCYLMFMANSEHCRPIFRLALLNFGFVITFKSYKLN